MKKLTLTVDDLRVESFSTSPAMQGHGGTVKAHEHTHPEDCYTRNDDRYTDDRYTDEFMTECGASCVGDTCPGSTEVGAYTCYDTCVL